MTWEIEATPKTVEQISSSQSHPEVVEAAHQRGIISIVHFTRTTGLKGILACGEVIARCDLPEEARIRHVYEDNSPDRDRDVAWHGYVNLSVTDINQRFLKHSRRWHPEDEWVILEFDPGLLGDPGVVFCTTNNAYPVVHRCEGLAGFCQMFAPRVPWGNRGSTHTRGGRAPNHTTDPQAEVLYPYRLSLDYLQRILVEDEATLETVQAILTHFPRKAPIVLVPEAFA